MLHLLPEQQKNLVIIEYHKRLAILVCMFVIATAAAGSVLLLPSYIVAYGRYSKVETKKEQAKERLALVSTNTNENSIKEVSDRIEALAPLGSTEEASAVFNRFLAISAPGIKSTSMRYILKDDKSVGFEVSGVATNRESLLAFADSVNKSGSFSGASVPLSSLKVDRDVTFIFKLTVKPSK